MTVRVPEGAPFSSEDCSAWAAEMGTKCPTLVAKFTKFCDDNNLIVSPDAIVEVSKTNRKLADGVYGHSPPSGLRSNGPLNGEGW